MNFKANLKDDVLRGLVMADIRAEGLSCAEDGKNPSVVNVTNGKANIKLSIKDGSAHVKPPSFVNDFVKKNPASRFIIALILLLVAGAYFISLELILIIPFLVAMYAYIFYRTHQALKAKYEMQVLLYAVVYRVMVGSIYMNKIEVPKGDVPLKKQKLHPALKFIVFLIVLFSLGSYFLARELLIMIPLLVFIYILTSIGIYQSNQPPKPKKEKKKTKPKKNTESKKKEGRKKIIFRRKQKQSKKKDSKEEAKKEEQKTEVQTETENKESPEAPKTEGDAQKA